MTIFTRLLSIMLVSAALFGHAPKAAAEIVEIECDFDNSSQFSDGANLPDGWLNSGSQLLRCTGVSIGQPAYSGDYLLATTRAKFDEVIYTPLVELQGGKPYTLEFRFVAPGGTPAVVRNNGLWIGCGQEQTLAAQSEIATLEAKAYTEWTPCKYTYTPDADGSYCFAIKIVSGQLADNCGVVAFDDFYITGTAAGGDTPPVVDLDPNPDNQELCIDIPYKQTFSDASDYTGDSYVPKGWLSVGSNIFRTANTSSLHAKEGTWYLITDGSSIQRDENAYTPFFNLEAGTEYSLSFYSYMEGAVIDDEVVTATLNVTVGTEQDADFHQSLLTIEGRRDLRPDWTAHSVKFTPGKSGAYCFSFQLRGPAYSGIAAVDVVHLTAPGLVERVEPKFFYDGNYDLMDSRITLFGGQTLKVVNKSLFADSYEWKVEGPQEFTSTETNPEFTFSKSGDYTLRLTATNERGSRSTEKTLKVKQAETDKSYVLMLLNDADDRYFDKGEVPTFDTDLNYDFVTGFNHHYLSVAQRYDMQPETEVEITSISMWITERMWRSMTSTLDDQRIRPMAIRIYGAKSDGSLDPDKVFGETIGTNGEFLGSSGLGGNAGQMGSVELKTPITATGTFFVALEFDKSMTVDPEDAMLGRSYFATGAIRFGSGRTTLYGKSTESGLWKRVDEYDPAMEGLGAHWHVWLRAKNVPGSSSIAVNTFGVAEFAALMDGNRLMVSGTSAGETLRVYTTTGALMLSVPTSETSTEADASSLPKGVYIVSAGGKAAKVLKK